MGLPTEAPVRRRPDRPCTTLAPAGLPLLRETLQVLSSEAPDVAALAVAARTARRLTGAVAAVLVAAPGPDGDGIAVVHGGDAGHAHPALARLGAELAQDGKAVSMRLDAPADHPALAGRSEPWALGPVLAVSDSAGDGGVALVVARAADAALFDAFAVQWLEILAAPVATALAAVHARAAADRRGRELRAVRELSAAVLAGEGERPLLEAIAAQARGLTGADAAGVKLGGENGEEEWAVAGANAPAPLEERAWLRDGSALRASVRGSTGHLAHVLVWWDAPPGDLGAARRALRALAHDAGVALEHARLLAGERAALDRARASEEAVDELLTTVSHELRSPLAAAGGFVDVLRRGGGGPLSEHQEQYLGIADRNIRRVNRLVDDLLTLGRLQSPVPREREEVALAPWLRQCLADLAPEAAERRLTLRLVPPDRPLTVMGVPDQLDQVIHNLVGNAVKFSPEGGEIEVRARETATGVQLTVADHGPGLAPDEARRAFDRFWRAPGALATNVPGTGLGLAIVREIVTAHGGRAWCEGRSGQGARFHVVLPASASVPARAAA